MSASAAATPAAGPSNWVLIRRLLGLSKRYAWWCVLLLFLQGLLLSTAITCLRLTGLGFDVVRYHSGAAETNVPLLPKRIFARPSTEPDFPFGLDPPADMSPMTQVAILAGLILLFELIRGGLNHTYIRTLGYVVHAKIVVDLRHRVYDKMQRLSFGFFDANATGTLINRVTGDVQSVRAFIDGVLIQFVLLAISLACYMGFMFSIHIGLTLVCLATTPVMWLITAIFSRTVRPLYDRNRELVDGVILKLAECIQGVHVIKGFGREPEEIRAFDEANHHVRDQQREIFWKVSLFTPFIGYMTQLNIVVLLAYGGSLVVDGTLQLGSGLIVFAGLLQQFSSQVANLTNIANSVQQSLSGARRVFEVLDAPIAVESPADPVRIPRARGDIRFEGVSFEYKPGVPVLREVSFQAAPGKKIAILGATGAGKTTLLLLLARFYDPTAGRITLDGVDLRELQVDDLRKNIGVVFQETFLFSNTVAANIAFGNPYASREQVERAAKIAAAHDFISELPQGYDSVLGEFGLDLSGGQRQRLAIARAVLLDPAILILDDPAAAIDAHTEHEILAAMEQAMQGRTTFVVAHRLSTLREADWVLVLENGRIVEQGTHDELSRGAGLYRRAADLQLMRG